MEQDRNKPIIKELEEGTYYWCSCGKSLNNPFCDGSHKGTDKIPLPVTVDICCGKKKTIAFCNCRKSKNLPYCDGSHKNENPAL